MVYLNVFTLTVLGVSLLTSATSIPHLSKRAAGSYIVTLKDPPSKSSIFRELTSSGIRERGEIQEWDAVMNGFAAYLTEDEVRKLEGSDEVLGIEEDSEVHARGTVTQSDATWGLGRLSSIPPVTNNPTGLNFPFTFDTSSGCGVDIYVLDSGVRTTHAEFTGRATTGAIFGGYGPGDGTGHGTHVAAIAAGTNYGVAKNAKVISVRVLSDLGSGTMSSVISGLNWIGSAASSSGRRSVVLIAVGGAPNTALNSAVTTLITSGISIVTAASNSNSGTESSSPAMVPGVLNVGASNILDARVGGSNFGPGVDIFAPGASIYSASHTSDTAYMFLTGTSMAAAHAAGVVAYILGLNNNALTVAGAYALLFDWALVGVLSNIPPGTTNRLLHIET